MASSITKSHDTSGEPGSTERDLVIQYNVLVGSVDTLCAKLDADGGVADTNYTTTVANLNSRIGDVTGTVIANAATSVAAGVAALVASLGGNANVLAIADARQNVTAPTGTLTAITDARGSGYPAISIMGSAPTVAGAGKSTVIRFDGVSQGLKIALSRSLASDVCLVWVGTAKGRGVPIAFADAANAHSLDLSLKDTAQNIPNNPHGNVIARADGAERTMLGGPGDVNGSRRIGVHTVARSGTTLTQWSPRSHAVTQAVAAGIGSGDVYLGRGPTGDYSADDLAMALVLAAPLTNAQAETILAYVNANHADGAGSASRFFVGIGDSITWGYSNNDASLCYPAQVSEMASWTGYDFVNNGRSGKKLADWNANVASDVQALYDASRTENLLIYNGGHNDLDGSISAATLWTNTKTYLSARRAEGWKILLVPVLDSNTTLIADYNALVQAEWSTVADYVVDASQYPELYAHGSYASSTYFVDGVHPTTTGYTRMAVAINQARFG